MPFDANVIVRQFGHIGRPWHHFRLKPNDPSYDSTAGMNDAATSGARVNLPTGIIYTDQINFGHGSFLNGAGPFSKFRDTHDDSTIDAYTILRFNGSTTADKALLNLSLKTTLTTDAAVADLRDVGFANLTIDCNGNSIAAGGTRNADGKSTIERGAYFNRCGNKMVVAENFTVLGASQSGVDVLGVFSATIRNFGVYECIRKSVRVGYNFENWVTGESIVHGLKMYDMHIRNNGSYTVVGGGDASGVWSKTNPYRGSAIFVGGRSCRFADGSYEVNGGPIVFGGGGSSGSGGRGSEASIFENWYIEANESGSAGVGSPDKAVGLMMILSKSDVGRITRDIFLNGGNSAGKPQQTVFLRNTDFDNTGIEQAAPGVSASWGPANYGEYPQFINLQSIKGLATLIEVDSETNIFSMPEDMNGPTNHVGLAPFGGGYYYGDYVAVLSDGTNTVTSSNTNRWFRHGQQVTLIIDANFSSLAALSSGVDLKLTGLPYAASGTRRTFQSMENFSADVLVPGEDYAMRAATTEVELWLKSTGSAMTRLQKAKLGASARLGGVLTYGM